MRHLFGVHVRRYFIRRMSKLFGVPMWRGVENMQTTITNQRQILELDGNEGSTLFIKSPHSTLPPSALLSLSPFPGADFSSR
jgi:hypothetical protein